MGVSKNSENMKQNLIIALILNLALLLISFLIFITKGVDNPILSWSFITTLTGVIVFSIFSILLLKQLRKSVG